MTIINIGLMSGTSLDGIDAAAVSITESGLSMLASHSIDMPADLKKKIQQICQPGDNEIALMAEIIPAFVRLSANAISAVMKKANLTSEQITAIGSHGQTVRHMPDHGFTLQLDDPSLLAELTGITVVADFRRRDIAAGGQGAPLVPAFHKAVFGNDQESRVVVNIGGISNITALPKSSDQVIIGFDTGPGNLLMDYWCQENLGLPYDIDGQWAASDTHDEILLETMLSEPFFRQLPPKSTGRELFNSHWLNDMLKGFKGLSPASIQATLCRLTARGISDAIKQHAPDTESIYICGGGALNKTLMKNISSLFPGVEINTTAQLGIAPQWVEAIALAWLAQQTLTSQSGNIPSVTGAIGKRVLGGVFYP
ncbi:anhydro-N-acetylmuramic acid kinase [Endozoicomonas sp. (ex Bugula neritina AB1)]|nr:anhydro-N-acetylmuramic acid kinase [Endozoicomonas sp. (ex Bugula neritina AB1)]